MFYIYIQVYTVYRPLQWTCECVCTCTWAVCMSRPQRRWRRLPPCRCRGAEGEYQTPTDNRWDSSPWSPPNTHTHAVWSWSSDTLLCQDSGLQYLHGESMDSASPVSCCCSSGSPDCTGPVSSRSWWDGTESGRESRPWAVWYQICVLERQCWEQFLTLKL